MRLAGTLHSTNFVFSGKVNEGAGYVRFMQEDKLLMRPLLRDRLRRNGYSGSFPALLPIRFWGIDLKSGDFNRPKTTGWFVDQDFIARSSTASSVVVQGVKEGSGPNSLRCGQFWGIRLPEWQCRLGERGGQGFAEVLVRDEARRFLLWAIGR